MSSIVTTIVEALTSFFTGIGTAITGFFEEVVLDTTGALTPFATWTLVFIGIAIASTLLWSVLRMVKR
jgi:hypothetical protein